MDMRLFLIRQRAKDAATLVFDLHMKGAIRTVTVACTFSNLELEPHT